MKRQTLTLCGLFLATLSLFSNSFANEDETEALHLEINRLYEDISLSVRQLPNLSGQAEQPPLLAHSDNATILAALERLNNKQSVSPSTDEITAARNKISSYKMLCHSAKHDRAIFDKYCSPAPYQDLYSRYAKQRAQ